MIITKHKVFLSPSDQTRNTYATGGTSEDVQCGRIALAAKAALERCGFEVGLLQYATMAEKCAASDAMGAELHSPIHSNAFDGRVIGTVVEEDNGDKTIKDFSGRHLGYYKKGRNVTTHFYGDSGAARANYTRCAGLHAGLSFALRGARSEGSGGVHRDGFPRQSGRL